MRARAPSTASRRRAMGRKSATRSTSSSRFCGIRRSRRASSTRRRTNASGLRIWRSMVTRIRGIATRARRRPRPHPRPHPHPRPRRHPLRGGACMRRTAFDRARARNWWKRSTRSGAHTRRSAKRRKTLRKTPTPLPFDAMRATRSCASSSPARRCSSPSRPIWTRSSPRTLT